MRRAAVASAAAAEGSLTCSSSACARGWPGMGMLSCTPRATTPGNTRVSVSAAACALGLPPSRQSSKQYSDWRTCADAAQHELKRCQIVQAWHASSLDKQLHRRVLQCRSCQPRWSEASSGPEGDLDCHQCSPKAARSNPRCQHTRPGVRHSTTPARRPPCRHPPGCCTPRGSCRAE